MSKCGAKRNDNCNESLAYHSHDQIFSCKKRTVVACRIVAQKSVELSHNLVTRLAITPTANMEKENMKVINDGPSKILRINQVWAVISHDETGEGICAERMGGTWIPLIAADEARLESIMPIAKRMAKHTNKKIKIIRFTQREEIMEVEP